MKTKWYLGVIMAVVLSVLSTPSLASNKWGDKEITVIQTNGIMIGYPNNYFKPDQAMTRREVAVALTRAGNKPVIVNVKVDNAVPTALMVSVLALLIGLALGWLLGRKKTEINPVVNVTTPEIKPVVNVMGGGGAGTYGGGSAGGSVTNNTFVEDRYRPTPATFAGELNKGSESFVKSTTRSSEGKDSINDDLEALKKFKKD